MTTKKSADQTLVDIETGVTYEIEVKPKKAGSRCYENYLQWNEAAIPYLSACAFTALEWKVLLWAVKRMDRMNKLRIHKTTVARELDMTERTAQSSIDALTECSVFLVSPTEVEGDWISVHPAVVWKGYASDMFTALDRAPLLAGLSAVQLGVFMRPARKRERRRS